VRLPDAVTLLLADSEPVLLAVFDTDGVCRGKDHEAGAKRAHVENVRTRGGEYADWAKRCAARELVHTFRRPSLLASDIVIEIAGAHGAFCVM
jgi:hypothetical protein